MHYVKNKTYDDFKIDSKPSDKEFFDETGKATDKFYQACSAALLMDPAIKSMNAAKHFFKRTAAKLL